MAAPLAVFAHALHVLVDVALLVLVDEVAEELLLCQDVLAGLFS